MPRGMTHFRWEDLHFKGLIEDYHLSKVHVPSLSRVDFASAMKFPMISYGSWRGPEVPQGMTHFRWEDLHFKGLIEDYDLSKLHVPSWSRVDFA